MKSDLRQLGKETAIYGISTILSRFLNFLLVPFYTNVFTQAEYGIITNVYAYIAFFYIIYLYGMESAYFKFASSKELGNETETFSTAFNSVFITSLIFSSIISLLKNPISSLFSLTEEHEIIVNLVAGILFFDAISNIIFARLRFHNKAMKFATFKTINIVFTVLLNIVLILKLNFRMEGVFISNIVASFLTFILIIPDLIKSYKLKIDRRILIGLLKFGLPFIPSGFAAMVTNVIDRPILLALTDASTVGIYQANYKLGIFMMLYVSMFQYAWQPFYLKKAKEQNAKELFARVFTYFTIFGLTIFVFLTLFIEDIIRIRVFGYYLIGKNFWSGVYIVPIVLLGYLFNGFYINFVAGLQIEKKTQYLPFVTGLGAIVNLVANFLLIPFLGMLGAAYATLVAYLSMAVYQYKLSQKFYEIKYEWRKVLQTSGISISILLTYYILKTLLIDYLIYVKILLFVIFLILLKLSGLIEFRGLFDLKVKE
ncbi:MAG: polysaccharide biosynthesis C-terminal domain-containing protein [Ignavibacteria bacterium]|nr:polysaccharide biosynthesis C-terminal domain-containing protein [Ignavibacteria bacterium]